MEIIVQGTVLFHGARRAEGESLIQEVMWFTTNRARALEYAHQRDVGIPHASELVVRKLLAFETIKPLAVLDCSKLDSPSLSSLAQDEHKASVVGAYDRPLRNFLLQNARAAHAAPLDGCMQCDGQVVLDEVSEKLRAIAAD